MFIIYFTINYQKREMIRKILVFGLYALLISSCSSEDIYIEGFEVDKWKLDNYGCQNNRVKQLELIKANSDLLLSRTQNEIKDYLGAPDEHELYERTRKFFYYYLESSNKCSDGEETLPRILQIRFSAMGISNEVFIKNE